MIMLLNLIVFFIYIVLGTIIAIISRKWGIKTSYDYYVAGYRLGGFLSAMTYAATTYSAFMMIGLVGFTYATGTGALGFELLYLITTLTLLALFSKKVWSLARSRGWISPAEMLSDLYRSRILGLIVAIIYLVALIPYISAQLIGIGRLFEGVGGYEYYVYGVFLGAVVIFIWTYIAGIWSVATTDAYQGLWMISTAIIYLLWLFLSLYPSKGVNVVEAFTKLGKEGLLGISQFWSIQVFLAFTIPWIFFAVTNPQVVQRLYMPKDVKSLRFMITLFAIFGLLYTLIVTLVGLGVRGLTSLGVFPLIKVRDLVTPTLLKIAHPLLSAVVFTSITAAAVSTADSIILTLASVSSRDLYAKLSNKPTEKRMLLIGYSTIITLVLIAIAIALLKPGFVVEMSVLSSVILLPLAPITLASWILPEKAAEKESLVGALLGLILGAFISMYLAIIYGPKRAFIATWLGVPISCWILLASTILTVTGYLISIKKGTR